MFIDFFVEKREKDGSLACNLLFNLSKIGYQIGTNCFEKSNDIGFLSIGLYQFVNLLGYLRIPAITKTGLLYKLLRVSSYNPRLAGRVSHRGFPF